jgi:hypothetical protein
VVVTGRDAVGTPGTASTSVAIGRANINLTASPAEPTANAAVTFTASVPTGALVDEYEWYVDGALLRTTSGNSTTHSFPGRGNHTVRVVVIGIGGGEIGSATLVLNVR